MIKFPVKALLNHSPNTSFTLQGEPLDFKVRDFWEWRNHLEEDRTGDTCFFNYIIQKALGNLKSIRHSKQGNQFELGIMNGIQVSIDFYEQKQFRVFSDSLTWNRIGSNVHVICRIAQPHLPGANPLELSNWNFLVTETFEFHNFTRKNKRREQSSLNLKRLPAMESNFGTLKQAIYCVAQTVQFPAILANG